MHACMHAAPTFADWGTLSFQAAQPAIQDLDETVASKCTWEVCFLNRKTALFLYRTRLFLVVHVRAVLNRRLCGHSP